VQTATDWSIINLKSLKELSDDYYEDIRDGVLPLFMPTPYEDLNVLLHGFIRGQMYILAGRPSMGKTAMAIDMAMSIAMDGHKVLFFSIESSEREIYERVYKNVDGSRELLQDSPLFIDDMGGLSLGSINNYCVDLSPDLVVVDYIQLMSTSGKGLQTDQIGEVCSGLKNIAKESNCSVLVISQLNRRVDSAEEKRPQLYDLRASGNLEQDADVVMMLYRADYYRDIPTGDWETECIVRKNRNGPIGYCRLDFDPDTMRFDK
jgi:replicative DNA helicase